MTSSARTRPAASGSGTGSGSEPAVRSSTAARAASISSRSRGSGRGTLPSVDAIVAILAGGRSTRMGRPKPGAELAGRPLVSYPVAAARAVDLEPWVIAKPDTELPPLDCRVLIEPAEPRHPLCGVVAALGAAEGRGAVAVAVDMPFVEDKLLAWIASHLGTACVEAEGRLQPLFGRYAPADAEPLAAAVESGAAAHEAV